MDNKKASTGRVAIIGVITGLLNGLFGSGGGVIAVPAMQKYLGVDTHKSHATAIAIILPLSCVSLIIYTRSAMPDIMTLLYVSVGGAVGGFTGAKLLNIFKASLLHKIFGIFMIAASIRMMF